MSCGSGEDATDGTGGGGEGSDGGSAELPTDGPSNEASEWCLYIFQAKYARAMVPHMANTSTKAFQTLRSADGFARGLHGRADYGGVAETGAEATGAAWGGAMLQGQLKTASPGRRAEAGKVASQSRLGLHAARYQLLCPSLE